jgi:RHH-type transcriptional regulator, rel operon repressor / antitoxin RelB
MAKELFSLRLPEEVRTKLELVADNTGRTKSFVAIEAINSYCDLQAWQIKAIKKGLKQADEGKFVSHEELKAKWESRLED